MPDPGRRVRHHTHHPAAPVAPGIEGGHVAVERGLQRFGRHAGAEREKEFPRERGPHARLAEDVGDHVGFAAEEDDVGLLAGGDVVILDDLDGVDAVSWELVGEGVADAFGALVAAARGDEEAGREAAVVGVVVEF